jgi:hypothetical protein
MTEKRLVERSEDKAAKRPPSSGANGRLQSGEAAKHERLSYEPPRAMRLGTVHAGAGYCRPGSGDAGGCGTPGNSAVGRGCNLPGNSAGGEGCDATGSGPALNGICEGPGSDPISA